MNETSVVSPVEYFGKKRKEKGAEGQSENHERRYVVRKMFYMRPE